VKLHSTRGHKTKKPKHKAELGMDYVCCVISSNRPAYYSEIEPREGSDRERGGVWGGKFRHIVNSG
jgi:hypothetical protein